MMLTLTCPDVLTDLSDISCGIFTVRNKTSGGLILIIKCTKEMILTAKTRKGFKFYVLTVNINRFRTSAIVTAFFDDPDEPLVLRTPLYDEDHSNQIVELLSLERFQVHFVDENNRELLGYIAKNDKAKRLRSIRSELRLAAPGIYMGQPDFAGAVDSEISKWFSNRTSSDDAEAISISFEEPLFPEDLYVSDSRPEVNAYHGRKVPMHTVLERTQAGHFSELDVVHVLLRVFTSDQIYHNPIRSDNKREFVDVLVITEQNVFLIQAKDSPNTEQILERTIDRKKATFVSHLKKAADQLIGSISHLQKNEQIDLTIDEVEFKLSIKERKVFGMIVVKEIFNEKSEYYSSLLFDVFGQTGVPCFLLDYPELHDWTVNRTDEESFVETLSLVFSTALEEGEFPRIRFWPHLT